MFTYYNGAVVVLDQHVSIASFSPILCLTPGLAAQWDQNIFEGAFRNLWISVSTICFLIVFIYLFLTAEKAIVLR